MTLLKCIYLVSDVAYIFHFYAILIKTEIVPANSVIPFVYSQCR